MLIVRHYRTILTMLKSFDPLVTEMENLAEADLAYEKDDENLAGRIAGSKFLGKIGMRMWQVIPVPKRSCLRLTAAFPNRTERIKSKLDFGSINYLVILVATLKKDGQVIETAYILGGNSYFLIKNFPLFELDGPEDGEEDVHVEEVDEP